MKLLLLLLYRYRSLACMEVMEVRGNYHSFRSFGKLRDNSLERMGMGQVHKGICPLISLNSPLTFRLRKLSRTVFLIGWIFSTSFSLVFSVLAADKFLSLLVCQIAYRIVDRNRRRYFFCFYLYLFLFFATYKVNN